MIFAVLIGIAVVLALIVAWRNLWANRSATRSPSTQSHAPYVTRLHKIAALSLDEAREEAQRLLAMPHRFECVESPASDADNLDALAPELRSLFARYERILAVGTESVIDRRLIAPFGWRVDGPWREHRTWQIGTSHEHGYVLVKPNREGVYDIDGMEDDELAEPTDASIYHWLILAAQGGD